MIKEHENLERFMVKNGHMCKEAVTVCERCQSYWKAVKENPDMTVKEAERRLVKIGGLCKNDARACTKCRLYYGRNK